MARQQQVQRVPDQPQAASYSIEETALATRTTGSSELAPAAAAAQQQYEIQGAIVLARQFPRNEPESYQRLMRSCARPSFAEEAEYSFPRGGSRVTGPSVNLAREAARVWGNVRYGLEIVRDDGLTRQIRGWAWDVETNTKVTAEDDFRKVVQRKTPEGTQWVQADERDLRELTNRRGAILVRNCILQLLPSDMVEDAVTKARQTLKDGVSQDPDAAIKWVVKAFDTVNVPVRQLEEYLGHPLAQCSADEIAELKRIYKSISDGHSRWTEYVAPKKAAPKGDKGADFAAEAAEREAKEAGGVQAALDGFAGQ